MSIFEVAIETTMIYSLVGHVARRPKNMFVRRNCVISKALVIEMVLSSNWGR